MATLGAVWSEEMKEKAAELKSGSTFTERIKSTAKLTATPREGGSVGEDQVSDAKNTVGFQDVDVQVQCEGTASTLKASVMNPSQEKAKLSEVEATEKDSFQQALSDLADPLVPVQGHGLISLTRLIEAKDPETLSSAQQVLAIFQKHLNHPDTYIYLAAINGLVALALSSTHRDEVIAKLCQEYALLPGPPTREGSSQINRETGQLRSVGKVASGDSSSSSKESSVRHRSPELRMKLGEALVRVAREIDELLPHYMEQIMASILTNARDPDPLVRASSLSNLADVAALARFSLKPFQNEVK